MITFFKKLSLVPRGLRYKTMVAFCLMSLIPLLICVWIVTTYIFPNINLFFGLSLGNMSFILLISIFISLLGLYITKEMIDPVIKVAVDAKQIANGDMERVIDVTREDEIGDLSTSLNIMKQKIKEHIEELKAYGERTKLINIEINKKVIALSSLLQIGNLICPSVELPTVLDFIVQKVSEVQDGAQSFVLLLDDDLKEFSVAAGCNLDDDKIKRLIIKENELPPNILVLDKDTPPKVPILEKIQKAVEVENLILLPVVLSRRLYGVLGVGNNKDDFVFTVDEKELLKVFVKQVGIAIENDILITKAKELAIKDELTGLYNQKYIRSRLDEEIKRSLLYQRPCGYLLINIDGFRDFHSDFGEEKTKELFRVMAGLLKDTVTEVDKVARLGGDSFAIVLPEKNKRQAAKIAEEIRGKVEDSLNEILHIQDKLTVSIGVSENPIDGSTADELMQRAEKLVKSAKLLGKNRIAV